MLDNLPLREKLLLVLAVPILALAAFAMVTINAKRQEAATMGEVAQLASLSVEASALVHELQKERGLTAGYLGSGGTQFGTELNVQRGETDRALEVITESLFGEDLSAFGTEFGSMARKTEGQLGQLSERRADILSQDVAQSLAIAYYTGVNTQLLEIIGFSGKLGDNAGVARRLSTYQALLLGKERAGIERATLNGALVAGRFANAAAYSKFVSLVAQQDAYFGLFEAGATDAQLDFSEASLAGAVTGSVMSFRNAGMAAGAGSALTGDAALWFQAATTRIDALKRVEDSLAEDMGVLTADLQSRASRAMIWAVILGTLTMGAGLAFGYVVSTNIRRRLSQITATASRVSVGDFASDGEGQVEGKDEIGQLSRSFASVSQCMEKLVHEVSAVTDSARGGDLSARGHSADHEGAYRDLVEGVNELVTAFVGPIEVTSDYVMRISKGEVPEPIVDDYPGDFNRIKDSLNQLVDVMGILSAETDTLTQAAAAGELSVRGDASGLKGGWAELVQGMNQTFDAFVAPITEAHAALEEVAQRNLSARMEGVYKGDFQKIKIALNTAVSNLDDGFSQVAEASDQVASAADQISAGSQSLAQGTSEQASTLEEVASSLHELTSMAEQSALGAREAKNVTDATRGAAETGVTNMERLSEAMDRIKDSSDRTAKIVKTIDEIAFQTNLLALNAAVEAARAGDAGKGFAVVAEEVRNLAMRSAEAAKSTAELIEESVTNAEVGLTMNTEVVENLTEMNAQAAKVSEVMDEISSAGDRQSMGVEQINTAVEQMNQVTQQAAANAEESSSASEELASQADQLKSMVSEYRLSARGSRSRVAAGSVELETDSANGHSSGGGAQLQLAGAVNRFHEMSLDDDGDTLGSF